MFTILSLLIHEHTVSSYLFVFFSFFSIMWFLACISYTCSVRFISKHFIFFAATVNGIVFNFSHLLFAYRNVIAFGILILYASNLQNLFCLIDFVVLGSFGSSTYVISKKGQFYFILSKSECLLFLLLLTLYAINIAILSFFSFVFTWHIFCSCTFNLLVLFEVNYY